MHFVTILWVLVGYLDFEMPVPRGLHEGFMRNYMTCNLRILAFYCFIMYHRYVCLLRRLLNYSAVGGIEFGISTYLDGFLCKSFSIGCKAVSAWRIHHLSSLHAFWELNLKVVEDVEKYKKWSNWADFYDSSDKVDWQHGGKPQSFTILNWLLLPVTITFRCVFKLFGWPHVLLMLFLTQVQFSQDSCQLYK